MSVLNNFVRKINFAVWRRGVAARPGPKTGMTIFSAAGLAVFGFAASTFASGLTNAVGGLNKTADQGYGAGGYTTNISTTIGTIVGAVLAFVGVIFLILMIYGGFTWMLARGNEQEVNKAKDLIIAAIIGLIIVLAAYAITSYVGGALTE